VVRALAAALDRSCWSLALPSPDLAATLSLVLVRVLARVVAMPRLLLAHQPMSALRVVNCFCPLVLPIQAAQLEFAVAPDHVAYLVWSRLKQDLVRLVALFAWLQVTVKAATRRVQVDVWLLLAGAVKP
jgi:hypothetical protein